MTTQDEEFQGVEVPAGSLLHLRFAAANVDEDEFACPFDLDLERAGVGRHVAFSTGPRVCPGAKLSRVEQQIAWGVLLDRLELDRVRRGQRLDAPAGDHARHDQLNLRVHKAAEPLALGTGRPPAATLISGQRLDRLPPLGHGGEPVGVGDLQLAGAPGPAASCIRVGGSALGPRDGVDPLEPERFDQPTEHAATRPRDGRSPGGR